MKYFDNASTTKTNPEVLKTYIDLLNKYYVNSESLYPEAIELNNLIEQARSNIASLLHVNSQEVIFTSCGSESNSTAIKGVAIKRQHLGKHIITSNVEHSSVLNSMKWLEEYLGFEITYLPVNQNGQISIEDLKNAIREDTILVSIMYVNNESGAINPIEEIKEIVKKYRNCYLHVDCVQAIGKLKVDLKDIDLASISAHKLNGLKGSAILVKKQHVEMAPLISGGQQEGHMRGGTNNACANIVFAKTLRLALENLEQKIAKTKQLHDYLITQLQSINNIVINSPLDGCNNIVNFSCLTITSQVMMNQLANRGYEVSAQSTCDSNEAVSHVISQMFKETNRLKGTIRISISSEDSKEEIDQFITVLKETIQQYG